jgi:hypothetical protein
MWCALDLNITHHGPLRWVLVVLEYSPIHMMVRAWTNGNGGRPVLSLVTLSNNI